MPKLILVIEDNFEVRENLIEILSLAGYDAVGAENGKVGVEMALNSKPDLILCDVMMPELDGFGVLKIIGSKQDLKDIPFIFLTAKAENQDFRKGMNLGADDYVTKPFDDVELLDAIEMRLKKHDLMTAPISERPRQLTSELREIKELEHLHQNRQRRKYSVKSVIYEEGDIANECYFIESGKVKTVLSNDMGKNFVTHIYKKGEYFGYMPMLKNHAHTESAYALTNVELSIIPKIELMQLIFTNQDLSSSFIKLLANNIEEKEKQLISLAYNSIRKRVAQVLLTLEERFEKEEKNDPITIKRDDLAAMAGTTKETVIRTLTDFKNEGIIKINHANIHIVKRESLVSMPN